MGYIKIKENENITKSIVEGSKSLNIKITDKGHIYLDSFGPNLLISSEFLLDLGEKLSKAVSEDFSLSVGMRLAQNTGKELVELYKNIGEEALKINFESLSTEEYIQRILEAHISNFKTSNYFRESIIIIQDNEVLVQIKGGLAEKYIKTRGKEAKKSYALFLGYYLGFIKYLLGIEEKEVMTRIRTLKDGFTLKASFKNS